MIAANGALAAFSGQYTGRCPAHKRVVRSPESQDHVWWGGASPNVPLPDPSFVANRALALGFMAQQPHIYVQDGYVNWGPEV